MRVANNCVVSIHYRLTNDQGELIDSSEGREPLVYLHGAGNIISGLEEALAGREPGEQFSVTVQPEDAYGEVDPQLIRTVPREIFEGVEEILPGMQFQAQGPDGWVQRVTVKAVEGDEVTIDANHPLAGQVLHFNISVEEVREASPEEIEHGHVH